MLWFFFILAKKNVRKGFEFATIFESSEYNWNIGPVWLASLFLKFILRNGIQISRSHLSNSGIRFPHFLAKQYVNFPFPPKFLLHPTKPEWGAKKICNTGHAISFWLIQYNSLFGIRNFIAMWIRNSWYFCICIPDILVQFRAMHVFQQNKNAFFFSTWIYVVKMHANCYVHGDFVHKMWTVYVTNEYFFVSDAVFRVPEYHDRKKNGV